MYNINRKYLFPYIDRAFLPGNHDVIVIIKEKKRKKTK